MMDYDLDGPGAFPGPGEPGHPDYTRPDWTRHHPTPTEEEAGLELEADCLYGLECGRAPFAVDVDACADHRAECCDQCRPTIGKAENIGAGGCFYCYHERLELEEATR